MARMTKVHHSLTIDRVLEAVENAATSLENPGFCIDCGSEESDVEPDARNYRCEACGQKEVFGAEELLIMIA